MQNATLYPISSEEYTYANDRLLKWLPLFMGVTSCMSSFQINIFGISMTVFTLLLMILVFYLLFGYRGKVYIYKNLRENRAVLGFYFILTLISSVLGSICMNGEWARASLIGFFSDLLGIIGIYFLANTNQKTIIRNSYIKGIVIGANIQAVWCIIQIIYFLARHSSLNYDLGFIHAAYAYSLSDVINGFNWERAQLCECFLLAYCFTERKELKILYIVLTILTQSRTAFLMLAFVLFGSIDYKTLFKKGKRINLRTVILFILLIFIFIRWGVYLWTNVGSVIGRFLNARNEGSGLAHLFYLTKGPEIFSKNSIFHNIFGFGSGCSGYPYSAYFGRNTVLSHWVVESSAMDILWSYGVVAFVFFFVWVFRMIAHEYKHLAKIKAFFLSVPVCSLFYTLLPNWVMLVLELETDSEDY